MGVSASPSRLPKTVKQIHSGTTVIPERFFAKCVHLEEIEFPEPIEEIGDGAFEYCRSLRRVRCVATGAYVSIPPKVKTIPCRCFYGCSSLLLTSRVMPSQSAVVCLMSYTGVTLSSTTPQYSRVR